MLYTELIIGLVKVVLYGLFIVIMVRIYTLPLFAVRPMYLTARAFKKAFNDVILSRRAIHNMNTWYPDATTEELENTDNVCIICREEMVASSTKKLPCNHIFHKNCLRSWFQRQQTCPTCRLDVLRAPLPGQQQQQQQRRPNQARHQPQQQQQQADQGGAGGQQVNANVQQLLAQFMAANGRLQFPPAPPPPAAAASASTGTASASSATTSKSRSAIQFLRSLDGATSGLPSSPSTVRFSTISIDFSYIRNFSNRNNYIYARRFSVPSTIFHANAAPI